MLRTALGPIGILATMLAFACLNTAMAQSKEQGYKQKKREINDIAVSIVVSGLQFVFCQF
jgi:hypothetical protein